MQFTLFVVFLTQGGMSACLLYLDFFSISAQVQNGPRAEKFIFSQLHFKPCTSISFERLCELSFVVRCIKELEFSV